MAERELVVRSLQALRRDILGQAGTTSGLGWSAETASRYARLLDEIDEALAVRGVQPEPITDQWALACLRKGSPDA